MRNEATCLDLRGYGKTHNISREFDEHLECYYWLENTIPLPPCSKKRGIIYVKCTICVLTTFNLSLCPTKMLRFLKEDGIPEEVKDKIRALIPADA